MAASPKLSRSTGSSGFGSGASFGGNRSGASLNLLSASTASLFMLSLQSKRNPLLVSSLARERSDPQFKSLSIADLPNSILARVFSYLPGPDYASVCLVCSLWRDVCQLPSAWGSAKGGAVRKGLLLLRKEVVDDAVLLSLPIESYLTDLVRIHLVHCPYVTDVGVQQLIKFSPGLLELKLIDCSRITGSSLRDIGYLCRSTQRVEIVNCPLVGNVGLNAVSTCTELQFFRVEHCPLVGHLGIDHVTGRCSVLERLEMGWNAGLRHCDEVDAVRYSSSLQMVYMACCGVTTYFDTSRPPSPVHGHESKEALPPLILHGNKCPNKGAMTEFLVICDLMRDFPVMSLGWSKTVTDTGLQYLVSGASRLRELDVSNSPALTDRGLRHLAVSCMDLRCINLRGCRRITDTGIEMLVSNARVLEEIDISACDTLTDAAVDLVVGYCSPHLTAFGMGLSARYTKRAFLTLSGCPHLVRVFVKGCKHISPATIGELMRERPDINLKAGCLDGSFLGTETETFDELHSGTY